MLDGSVGPDDMMVEECRYIGGVLIEGGSDTTLSFLQSLILALVAFPEAQQKAPEEMDGVVGEHRMPRVEDWEGLTYVKAIVKEVCGMLVAWC